MWSDYSQNLVEAVREPEDVATFRNRWPEKFRTICITQLSFVLDTPLDVLSEIENQTNAKDTPMKRFLSCTKRRLGSDLQPLKLTSILLDRLNYLIAVLEGTDALNVEGVFRKTGNLAQQRAVADALLHPDFNCTSFKWREYSAHELAGAFKSIISHLVQPLLTNGLAPFYLQAARLWGRNPIDDKDDQPVNINTLPLMERYAYSKQVNALRLLTLLLPQMHHSLLQRLLMLLHRVTTHVARNRMTPLALGTVFGPVFLPSVFSESFSASDNSQNQNPTTLKRDCQDAIALTTRMIELNSELFLFPTRLINDIRDNASPGTPGRLSETREKRLEPTGCSPYRRGHASRRSSSPINISFRYAHVGYGTPRMFRDVSNTTAVNTAPTSSGKMSSKNKFVETKLLRPKCQSVEEERVEEKGVVAHLNEQ
ncbi:hypothetical protein Aperf_G00000023093 [Anoplocephala perfoliata]